MKKSFILPLLLVSISCLAQDALPLQNAPIIWKHGDKDALFLRNIPTDWSEYQAIGFTLTANHPLQIPPTLIFSSEDLNSPGMDYYSCSFPINFTGSRDYLVPFKGIGKIRNPMGWNKIDFIEYHADWSGQKRQDATGVITITNLRLLKGNFTNTAKGPRMNDLDFFNLLDYTRPELAEVKTAAMAKDYAAARHALAKHLRTRTFPRWQVAPQDRPTRQGAVVTQRAAADEGGRFYSPMLPLDWQGWQKVEFNMADLKSSGTPLGIDLVSAVRLKWLPATKTAPGARINLDDIALVLQNGTSKSLGDFESTVLGWTPWTQDKSISHSGSASAKWQFPKYFKNASCNCFPRDWTHADKLVLWVHVPDRDAGALQLELLSYAPDTRAADAILTHKFPIGSFKNVVHDFGKRIDWSCNPMDKGETKTVEWNAQLNRHFHFSILYNAYWQTGDDKYAEELAHEMNSWIEDCPILLLQSGNHPYHHAWETLNTGIRLHQSWPDTLFRCLESPAFTDDIIINILKSIAEQVQHLRRWPSQGNWLTAESFGVYVSGLLFPEFKEARIWRQDAIAKLHRQLSEEVYPDGVQFELALGYNTWTLAEFLGAYEAALRNDMTDEFPDDYKHLIEKMYEYLMKISMPDGQAFGLNDASNQGVRSRLLSGYLLFPEREDFVHAALAGNQAFNPPERDSFGMHWAGHYVMRSGWTANSNVMLMDAGPWGRGHQHEDKLSIALSAYGQLLLPDGGVTMYDNSRWRAYTLRTRAHNSVLVDGMDQFNGRYLAMWPLPWTGDKPDTDSRWFSAPGVDFAEGWFKQQYREYSDHSLEAKGFKPSVLSGIHHRRSVIFAKPNLWVVHDTLFAEDDQEHTAEVLYHINASEAKQVSDATVVATTDKAAGLAIAAPADSRLAIDIVKGKMEPPVQGWSSVIRVNRPEGIPMTPLPTAIFKQSWKKRGDIVTVLRPFPNGQTLQPVVTSLPAPEQVHAATIAVSPGETCLWLHNEQPAHNVIEIQGIKTDAEAAFVSLEGRDKSYCLVEGTILNTPEITISLDRTGTCSLRRSANGSAVVAVSHNVKISLKLPDSSKLAVYRLDRRNHRVETIAPDAGFSWSAVADAEYELAMPGTPSLEESRQNQAALQQPQLDFPVKPLPDCGKAPKGIELLLQAESPTAQGNGEIAVTDKKIGTDQKAFLHWDNPGHWLEYTFNVPASGAYQLHVKYCVDGEAAIRAILVDGFCPHESLTSQLFMETGGWSSARDDWQWFTIPFSFNLTKGKHTFRLVNFRNSMNMDALKLTSVQ